MRGDRREASRILGEVIDQGGALRPNRGALGGEVRLAQRPQVRGRVHKGQGGQAGYDQPARFQRSDSRFPGKAEALRGRPGRVRVPAEPGLKVLRRGQPAVNAAAARFVCYIAN